MKQGKNDYGWTTPDNPNERPLRDRDHGLAGQEIWFELENLGFVHDYMHEEPTEWENKLKSWLIHGYWEDK